MDNIGNALTVIAICAGLATCGVAKMHYDYKTMVFEASQEAQ